jgi:hypothetical protein
VPTEDARFTSDGCALAGTYIPAAAPVAAALLITGSGRTNRDSDAWLPFRQTLRSGITKAIAGALDGAQVSTLRYDKRGTGASGGDYLATVILVTRDARVAAYADREVIVRDGTVGTLTGARP